MANDQGLTTNDESLTLRVQNGIDLAIDSGGVAGGVVNGLSPLLVVPVELRLL
jgi:hypothetical protein